MNYIIKNDCYLMHHGVMGMHWGIRRYQNPDGTLTAEGKHRYRTNVSFRAKVNNYKTKDQLKSEGVKGLTNYFARQYMTKAYLTGHKLNREDAVYKAQQDTRAIKTMLGVAGGVMAAGLSIAIPSVASGLMAYRNAKSAIDTQAAQIQADMANTQAKFDRWNNMTDEEKWAELRSRQPKH